MSDKERLIGLTSEQASQRLIKYGNNEITQKKKQGFFVKLIKTVCEPMFLLLIAAAIIYFILGEPSDGAVMLVFVVAVIAIDVVQEWKTDKTISALKSLSAPQAVVIRNGAEIKIPSADIVPGDVMLICEGVKIPADGKIIKCSDLYVDESTLTGESDEVAKIPYSDENSYNDYWRSDFCYAGTLCKRGSAAVLVTCTGAYTEYGKISRTVAQAPDMPTPLQKQTNRLVKISAVIAGALFLLVTAVTYFNLNGISFGEKAVQSVLSGITLAMAMIPEEFPVILTVFLSMGAWRLARKKSLVRRMPSVETLGSVSVLCVDKTGTITMNEMTVSEAAAFNCSDELMLSTAKMACEIDAYDPMEKAIISFCQGRGVPDSISSYGEIIKEYSFNERLKMMGHVWRKGENIVIAAKGSFESILSICGVDGETYERANKTADKMSKRGLRVIAVAGGTLKSESDIPPCLESCKLEFMGLIALADPPRKSVEKDIKTCKNAGIRVVMITGDHKTTASSIAQKVGISDSGNAVTGDMIDKMSDETLRRVVGEVNVFSRVTPEHKMRIVKALRDRGEVVAMTGDGVNDAPALKYADIGIAMGKRGSEVSREAADLILLDDNFSTIVDTVRDGRRIFDNIRKAVGYIFTIHIPIALASLLAPMLGLSGDMLMLLPLHIVLLELLIDPTCSIVLERQPAEDDIMSRPPRNRNESIINFCGVVKSVIQGVVIFAASFASYITVLNISSDSKYARAVAVTVIMLSNLFLVFVNSSEIDSAAHSLTHLARDKVMWITAAATVLLVAAVLYTPLSAYLKLAPLGAAELAVTVLISFAAVGWYEAVKLIKRRLAKKRAKG